MYTRLKQQQQYLSGTKKMQQIINLRITQQYILCVVVILKCGQCWGQQQVGGNEGGFLVGSNNLGGWRKGRATFYGNEHWMWNIHEGSCGFGYLCEDEGTGWDVAAMPDTHYEYVGSCGRCYEVACDGVFFQDNYGNTLDRTEVCYDSTASVVITVTDTCKCNYPNNYNYYSNRRWCCGDMDHFDLSIWAYEKLADLKWGVIGLQYRPVPCDFLPAKEAIPKKTRYEGAPHEGKEACPKNQFVVRPGRTAQSVVSQQFVDAQSNAQQVQQQQQKQSSQVVQAPSSQQQQLTGATSNNIPLVVYQEQLRNGWEWISWNVEQVKEGVGVGVEGGAGICGRIFPGGAVSVKGPQGSFNSRQSVEFWIKTDQYIPDINIQVAADYQACNLVPLRTQDKSGVSGVYSRYDIYLNRFNAPDPSIVVAFIQKFTGCDGVDVNNIRQISFRNDKAFEQYVCIDEIKILG